MERQGTNGHCPPYQLSPSTVVRYGDSVSVNCSTSVPHDGMGWESSEGGVPMTSDSLVTLRVANLRRWDLVPICYINYNEEQCVIDVPIITYKTPGSVSISPIDNTVIEGNLYELQCDIQDVAPVRNLNVKWYKGQTLVNLIKFNDTTKTPENVTATLFITPDRADDGVQYRCEAELDLGQEGPQPPPRVKSESLNITVHFKPIIDETKLPSKVPVFRGYPTVLVCEAEGHPKPTISWNHNNNIIVTDGNLTILEATYENDGIYYCTATNSVATTIRSVTVVVQDISIITVNHTGPMILGSQYELQCCIQKIFPDQSLVVRWYKGQTLVDLITVNSANRTTNVTTSLSITPVRTDDGVQYRCEAELQLGAEGPQSPTRVTSESLYIAVHVKPIINETKLPSKVPVFRGYPTVLVCEAEGHPKPTISWGNITNVIADGGNLTITEATPENIYCIANNSAGTTTRNVIVVLKEDYLPIIAGLVAITVVFILVIFIFIYSIYYKKAKMGHYSPKDAKPTQNGNIAQNGKDNSIPMKKLSQSIIPA
ncbi:inactive tyrosine-protein kinase 7-like isoform X2 [Xyrauchen texanus]|uniref:inactive tyrosine-protein kinase 7-like isoform X2 n=1 Tax=Xyrauchen texanus TaxID=154827 RepID=UPI002241A504|nr:inactive tyrosine-protein kinase 7-like isoform X2 [Xyrauchen texanus]